MSDDKIKWHHLFTMEPEGKIRSSEKFPEASEVIENLPNAAYKKKWIKKNQKGFLIELFDDAAVMNSYYALFDFLDRKHDLLLQDPSAFECFTVHMLRALVIYLEGFNDRFPKRAFNEILIRGVCLFRVFLRYKPEQIPYVDLKINELFNTLSEVVLANEPPAVWTFFESFVDAILAAMDTTSMHFVSLVSTKFVLVYARQRAGTLTNRDFKKEDLFKLISIMHSLWRISPTVCNQHFEDIPVQMAIFVHYLISKVVFFEGEWTMNVNELYRFASYCFTEFVTLVGKVRGLAKELEKRGFYDAFAKFIYWSADMFPAFKIESRATTFNADEMKMASPEWIKVTNAKKPPAMTFTRNTFQSDLGKLHFEERTATAYPDDFFRAFTDLQQVYKIVRLFNDTDESFLIELMKKIVINVSFRVEDSQCALASRYYILVCMFISMPQSVKNRLFVPLHMAETLVKLFVFEPKYSFQLVEKETDDLVLFRAVRQATFALFCEMFRDNAAVIFDNLSLLIEAGHPQVVDQVLEMLHICRVQDKTLFAELLCLSKIAFSLTWYDARLQATHIYFLDKGDNEWITRIVTYRKHIFELFATVFKDSNVSVFGYASDAVVASMFHHLFEPSMMEWTLKIMEGGLCLKTENLVHGRSPCQVIMSFMGQCVKAALDGDLSLCSLKLLHGLMKILAKALKVNQKEMFTLSERYELWPAMSPLPWKVWTHLEQNKELKLQVINGFIYALSALAREHHEAIQGAILNETDHYMEKFAHLLSEIEYGQETADALLTLICESEVSFAHLPTHIELKFCEVLPYIHTASQHLHWHAKIFGFVKNMCKASLGNTLHVFETPIPSVCLEFVRRFPDMKKVPEIQKRSINVLLELYQLISERVYKPVTFEVMMNVLKETTEEQQRPWYTSVLLKSVQDILAHQTADLPSSFFHFEGLKSGISVPALDGQRNWTYVCRFQLDESRANNPQESVFLCIGARSTSIVLTFDDENKLKVCVPSATKKKSFEHVVKCEFKPNDWYTFMMAVNGTDCMIYINGRKVSSFSLRNTEFKVGLALDKFQVCTDFDCFKGCSLSCNITCLYFFNSVLTKAQRQALASLPLNYIQSFLPSNKGLLPNAPNCLFTGELESSLVFCYNARMTTPGQCANLKPESVGSAILNGHVVSFSASFYDACLTMRGLINFLLLFDQVERTPVSGTDLSKQDFLIRLLKIFSSLTKLCSDIEDEFCNKDGIKALGDCLCHLGPDTFTEKALLALSELYNSLRNAANRKEMLLVIWNNRNIWKGTARDVRLCVVRHLTDIYQHDTAVFEEVIPFGQFLAMITFVEDDRVRLEYIEILILFAKHTFPIPDQKLLFSFGFHTYTNPVIQVQILDAIYRLVADRVCDCHVRLMEMWVYASIIGLALSGTEDVRLLGVQLLIIADSLHNDGFLGTLPLPLVPSLQLVLKSWNSAGSSDHGWNTLRGLILKQTTDPGKWTVMPQISSLLQLICGISHHHKPELVMSLFKDLSDAMNDSPGDREGVRCATSWEMNMLFCAVHMKRPLDSQYFRFVHDVYASVWFQVILKEKPKMLGAIISRIRRSESKTGWSLVPFLRSCLVRMLLKPEAASEANSAPVVFFSMVFMYLMPEWELYVRNLELDRYHRIPIGRSPVPAQLPEMGYREFIDLLIQPQTQSYKFVLHTRFDQDGRWLDIELANTLSKFLETISPVPESLTFTYHKSSLRIMDLLTLNECYLIRNGSKRARQSIDLLLTSLTHYSFDNALLSLSLLVSFMYPKASLRDDLSYLITRARSAFGKQKVLDCDEPIISMLQIAGPKVHDYINYVLLLIPKHEKMTLASFNRMADGMRDFVKITDLPNESTDFDLVHDVQRQYAQTLPHMIGVCAKSYRHIKTLLTNFAVSWEKKGRIDHWQLGSRIDRSFRHVMMKPNWHFDVHKMASLLRDTNDIELAGKEFDLWAETQKTVQLQSQPAELEAEVDEESRPEYSFTTDAILVSITSTYKGELSMNSEEILFDGKDEENDKKTKVVQILLRSVIFVFQRNYQHIPSGIEVFVRTNKSYFFFFPKMDRRKVMRFISHQPTPMLRIFQTGSGSSAFQEAKYTEKWLAGQLSNYSYLMYINLFAGRSFNDLSQYPVFPWVLADYTSKVLNLDNPQTFRDLSKPIGVMNEQRLEKLKVQSECDEETNHCLYRMHYSNAYYVSSYMIRVEPFTSIQIKLQNGQFDNVNRMFRSIPAAWKSAIGTSTDFRELIPELFTTPQILKNYDGFDLREYGDVVLPPWASSAEDFIAKHRQALESPYVTEHLHQWIDLIFGCKQSGKEAVAAMNTFHPYFYPSSITKDVMKNKEQLNAIQSFALNFGIIPNELFSSPHPSRSPTKMKVVSDPQPLVFEEAFKASAPAVFLSSYESNFLLFTANGQLEVFTKKDKSVTMDLSSIIGAKRARGETCAYFPTQHIFIAASPCDSCFHSYKVDGSSVKPLASCQTQDLVESISSFGNSGMVLWSGNTSLAVWRVSGDQMYTVYKITPHSAPVMAMCVSFTLGIMISADKQRNILFSNLHDDGRYISHFTVEGHVSRLMMDEDNTLVVACTDEQGRPRISSYTLSGVLTAEAVLQAPIRAWCHIPVKFASTLLVVALEDKTLSFYELPMMRQVYSTQMKNCINAFHFDSLRQTLLAASDNCSILTCPISWPIHPA